MYGITSRTETVQKNQQVLVYSIITWGIREWNRNGRFFRRGFTNFIRKWGRRVLDRDVNSLLHKGHCSWNTRYNGRRRSERKAVTQKAVAGSQTHMTTWVPLAPNRPAVTPVLRLFVQVNPYANRDARGMASISSKNTYVLLYR